LLTAERAAACLREAGREIGVLGFKIQPLPATVDFDTRLAYLQDGVRWLDRVAGGAGE
jgi:hypothetical protein